MVCYNVLLHNWLYHILRIGGHGGGAARGHWW